MIDRWWFGWQFHSDIMLVLEKGWSAKKFEGLPINKYRVMLQRSRNVKKDKT